MSCHYTRFIFCDIHVNLIFFRSKNLYNSFINFYSNGDWLEMMKDCNAFLYYGLENLFSYITVDRLLPIGLSECQFLILLDRVQSYPSYKRVSKENVNKTLVHETFFNIKHFTSKYNKTAGYHRHILRLLIFVKKAFKKTKKFFLEKTLLHRVF